MSVALKPSPNDPNVVPSARVQPIWEVPPPPWWVQLINHFGGFSRRLGRRWPRLDPEAMIAVARKRAGLSEFGDDRFREGLCVLIDAFEATDAAHAFGRILFREYCIDHLVNKLLIHDDLVRHPEILEVPIERPIIITGLPRSGTTFLHRLMSEDPRGRTLLYWESMMPSPPVESETYKTDPRIKQVRKKLQVIERLSPRLATAHELEAEAPEEDNNLFANEFVAGINGFAFDVPDYVTWLREQDLTPVYHSARRQLQHLMWKCRSDYWILKAPAHLFGIDALLAAFPDASVVVMHRDPTQVIPSLCSLAAAWRSIANPHIDLHRLGAQFAEAMARGPELAIAARKQLDPARFLDLSYKRLVADPIAAVESICHRFGYEFSDEYQQRCQRYLAVNPQHKHGVHKYSLADFGLTADTVNQHFAAYREWLAAHMPEVLVT